MCFLSFFPAACFFFWKSESFFEIALIFLAGKCNLTAFLSFDDHDEMVVVIVVIKT
jgi:hypothetical protein